MPGPQQHARPATVRRLRGAGLLAALLLALSLAGCALPRRIDSDVQSFASPPVPAPGTSYQFERLPSQTGAGQDTVEALAAQALARVGLVRAAAGAPAALTVQLGVQISPLPNPNALRPGPFFGGDHHLPGHPVPGLWLNLGSPWYRHAVQLVLRESGSARVAYETRASFDGPWADSLQLLPVIFDAALEGYPHPPAGPRKVITELPAPTPP